MIDPATWEPHETKVGPSFWGHVRLKDEDREKYLEIGESDRMTLLFIKS